MTSLVIQDHKADARFREAARAAQLDPDDPWVGGYVAYQWTHMRHLVEALPISIVGRRVLEFGCNFGASSIVLATLGARVTAVDVDESAVDVATLNAARYGVADAIEFVHVPDTTRMPFAPGQFDLITCVSVLEYVYPEIVGSVQQEISRVLKQGGLIMIAGTSSRAWPREVHSGRWFANYIPDSWVSPTRLQRGILPWQVRYGFGSRFRNLDRADGGRAFLASRRAMGASGARAFALGSVNLVARVLGVSVGLLLPNISVTLQKDD
jgi:2-polyprenyl-3-methyl-5-hydroxy-6-metoxy-1,4-benzoquinol methylase